MAKVNKKSNKNYKKVNETLSLVSTGVVSFATVFVIGCVGMFIYNNHAETAETNNNVLLPQVEYASFDNEMSDFSTKYTAASTLEPIVNKENVQSVENMGTIVGVNPVSSLTEEEPEEEYIPDGNIYNNIFFDGDVSDDMVIRFYELLFLEPDGCLDALDTYGAQIYIGSDDKYTDGYAGVFRILKKEIGINTATECDIDAAVNHEIGHCLDEYMGVLNGNDKSESENYSPQVGVGISNSPEFKQIYEAEVATSGYSEYHQQSSVEFFAETYRYMIENDTEMLANVPLTTAYIRQAFADNLNIVIP